MYSSKLKYVLISVIVIVVFVCFFVCMFHRRLISGVLS